MKNYLKMSVYLNTKIASNHKPQQLYIFSCLMQNAFYLTSQKLIKHYTAMQVHIKYNKKTTQVIIKQNTKAKLCRVIKKQRWSWQMN